ncbi:hypothetical protein JCM11641_001090 [Rhodosporidiobolus odoratus]
MPPKPVAMKPCYCSDCRFGAGKGTLQPVHICKQHKVVDKARQAAETRDKQVGAAGTSAAIGAVGSEHGQGTPGAGQAVGGSESGSVADNDYFIADETGDAYTDEQRREINEAAQMDGGIRHAMREKTPVVDDAEEGRLDGADDEDRPCVITPEALEEALQAAESVGFGHLDAAKFQLASFKVQNAVTRATMDDMLDRWPMITGGNGDVSEHSLYRFLHRHSHLDMVKYNCCPKSHMAYTNKYENLTQCHTCQHPRFTTHGKPCASAYYFQPALALQSTYRSPDYAEACMHRHRFVPDAELVKDVFDGELYQELRKKQVEVEGEVLAHKYFDDAADVALCVMTDGFLLFDKGKSDCWPVIGINYNLPPDQRYRTENVIPLMLIPGPNKPSDWDSFLFPLVKDSWSWARHGTKIFDSYQQKVVTQRIYILAFSGDMPAMAMLMAMKGHTGTLSSLLFPLPSVLFLAETPFRGASGPAQISEAALRLTLTLLIAGILACRDCEMPGLKGDASTYYHPLSSPAGSHRASYDPRALPLRTHREWLKQATEVKTAPNPEFETLSTKYGINSVPAVSRIPGVDMVRSFNMELMHLVLENIVKGLVQLWQGRGKYKEMPHGPWYVRPALWTTIDQEVLDAGSRIPTTFGKRMPAPSAGFGSMTAEDFSNFFTLIGPAVLLNRLPHRFYEHFLQLRDIYLILTDVNSIREQVKEGGELDQLIIAWVQKYESLYYGGNPTFLKTQTLPVHCLLHASSHIRAQGPLHLSWSFVMERYCQAAGNLVTNRTFPYANLALSMLCLLQVASIHARYPSTRVTSSASRHVSRTTTLNPPSPPDQPGKPAPPLYFFRSPSRPLIFDSRHHLSALLRAHLMLPDGAPLPAVTEWAQLLADEERERVDTRSMQSQETRARDCSWIIVRNFSSSHASQPF